MVVLPAVGKRSKLLKLKKHTYAMNHAWVSSMERDDAISAVVDSLKVDD